MKVLNKIAVNNCIEFGEVRVWSIEDWFIQINTYAAAEAKYKQLKLCVCTKSIRTFTSKKI